MLMKRFSFFSLDNAAIWELPTDYYMHNLKPLKTPNTNTYPLTQWFSPLIQKYLPNSTSCAIKCVRELIRIHSKDLEMIDSYSNYYLPYKLTVFEDNIAYQISLQARNFMPTFRTNFSPFEPGRRREDRGNNKNPSLTGQSSTSSTTSSTSSSSGDDETSSDDEQLVTLSVTLDHQHQMRRKSGKEIINVIGGGGGGSNIGRSDLIKSIFPSMDEIYDTKLKQPKRHNINV